MARLVRAGVWVAAGFMLGACGVSEPVTEPVSDAATAPVSDGAIASEVAVASQTPAPTGAPEPLDLELDPAAIIMQGKGGADTLNGFGWENTELPVGDYLVHMQCRGIENLTFTYHPMDRAGPMETLSCGEPQQTRVSAPEPGYYLGFNVRVEKAEGVEYIFAVTAPDYSAG